MKIFIVIFLIVCVIAIGVFFATPSTQGQKEQQEQKDEATVVQKGQVTDKEREYSKEYKKMYSFRKSRKFSEIIEESEHLRTTTEELRSYLGIPGDFFLPNAPVITPAEFLAKLSCKADAIVVGSIKSKASHMTEDETFIYTEYEFTVQDILKNNSSSPIEVDKSIEITRPGGLIKLDNRRIRVEDQSYEPLQKNKEYLLFLRFVPTANGYMVASPAGDFVLENNSFKTLSKRELPKELLSGESHQTLLNEVRNSVSVACKQNARGGKQ